MVAYSEADAVEGLDVDKYHFDKFGMRHTVDTVLRELWKDERCLMDLMAMAAPDHPQCATPPQPPLAPQLFMRIHSDFSKRKYNNSKTPPSPPYVLGLLPASQAPCVYRAMQWHQQMGNLYINSA